MWPVTVEFYDTYKKKNYPHWDLNNHAYCQWPPLCCWTLWNLSVLNWTSFLCVCVFACVCDAFVHKGILLYESLWWWLCKFHLFSSLLPVIAQVPTSHPACASPRRAFSSSSSSLYLPPLALLLIYISWPAFVLTLHSLPFFMAPTRMS